MSMTRMMLLALLLVTSMGLGLAGCNKSPETTTVAPATQVSDEGHSPDGWWCNEHGVLEEVCALCSTKLAMDFKAKGDWCQEHDRPESQCFVCHPEKEAEFAVLYEAKYGRIPPPREEPQAAPPPGR